MHADSFEAAIALERSGSSTHALVIPDGWQQGRGAFGGVILGASLAAMMADEPDPARAPRAFMGDICAPALPTASIVETRVLRRGKNQTNLACTFTQDGQVIASSSAVLAAPRNAPGNARLRTAPPAPSRWEDAEPVELAPHGPAFTRHYEYRVTAGRPGARQDEPVVTGWVRERVPPSRVTPAVLLARLDAFWPTLFAVEDRIRPAATVSFMAEFLGDPGTLDPAAPLFYRARAIAESGGYFVELRELWSGDEIVALNQQSFAILG